MAGAKTTSSVGFFNVEGSAGSTAADTKIIIEGDVPQGKTYRTWHESRRNSDRRFCWHACGSEMIGGSIFVKGNAGSWLALR